MTQASITIHDVNDSPPTFNQKNYFISLAENTPVGTPLPIEMSVRDPDVGQNAVFDLRLEDVSGVFDIEPKHVTGSTQISIRVANGTLDYENPNQRKFIVLVSSRTPATHYQSVSLVLINSRFETDCCRRNGHAAKTVIDSHTHRNRDRYERRPARIRARIVLVQCERNGAERPVDRHNYGERLGFGAIRYEWHSVFVVGHRRRIVRCERKNWCD